MDLEAPLRTIASSVEAEVLRVLAGADTEFTAPQIQRLAPTTSQFGVRKALARLAEAGLVDPNELGVMTWRGNRHHVLWPAIELAVRARVVLVDRIREQVDKLEGVQAYLYGSFARRQASVDSDVDFLLVFPDHYDEESMIDEGVALGQLITTWSGNPGHSNSMSRSYLRDAAARRDPLVEQLRADSVPIVGPAFSQLLSELADAKVRRAG